MNIVVTSNCQTSGISAALRGFLPGASLSPFPITAAQDPAGQEHLVQVLQGASDWLVNGPAPWIQEILGRAGNEQLRVTSLPDVYFDGYHPDLVYAWRGERPIETDTGPYQSAILLWAWSHGVDQTRAKAFFSESTLRRLDYLDRWAPAAERFVNDMAAVGLDGRAVLRRLRSNRPFMYSVNHPAIDLMVEVARDLSVRLDPDHATPDEPVEQYVLDGLREPSVIWPVYPPIARALGMTGTWTWKLSGSGLLRFDDFVNQSYIHYSGIDPSELAWDQMDWSRHEHVLSEELSLL